MTNPMMTNRNRANALLSTGPRTDSGKQRSSLNALRHGLTAASAVLPSEDPAAFDAHRRGFLDEYQPATPTETQLTQELADTAWRLNRILLLEAELLSQNPNPQFPCLPPSARTTGGFTSSKRASTRSVPSKPTAPSASVATSKTPPPSSNYTNTKEFLGSPPNMASFFQKTKSKPSPTA